MNHVEWQGSDATNPTNSIGGASGRVRRGQLLCLLAVFVPAAVLVGCGSSAIPSAARPTPTESLGRTVSPSPAATATSSPTAPRGIFTVTATTEDFLFQHAAVVLRDGRVLVVGGDTDGPSEIYDPSTGTWAATGSLSRKRTEPSAVTLLDGRVLVVGATLYPDPTDTGAELYDPASGKFTAAKPPIDRAGAAVSLLADGRVLIAGGGDVHSRSDDCLTSAALYDPASGKFTSTGSMKVARAGATATTLADGRVLIAGGGCGDPQAGTATSFASAEIYDPASGRFTPAGDMTAARQDHTATLLADGRVLVVGGYSFVSYSYNASADIFDPETNSFAAAGPMSTPRADHVAALLHDGRVLVAGGMNDDNPTEGMATAELFDPATGSFTPTSSMKLPRALFTATVLPDGDVLIVGGNWLDRSCELYHP
jgi:hypothetical protein